MLSQHPSDQGPFHQANVEPLSVWAERDLRARFVIDDDLNIAWRNAAADVFIDEVGVFIADSESLTLRNIRQRETFRGFIRASGNDVSSLCLPFSKDDPSSKDDHVLCTAVNLINGGRPRATGLTLRRASRTTPVGASNLEAAFHLTPSERKVVETLFKGHTAEQIGEGLRLSVGTVRVHIRHIYKKLDVCSREAMFHKLLPFMLVR